MKTIKSIVVLLYEHNFNLSNCANDGGLIRGRTELIIEYFSVNYMYLKKWKFQVSNSLWNEKEHVHGFLIFI